MKKVIIPAVLILLVACKQKEEQWRKDAIETNKELKALDVRMEYTKWYHTHAMNYIHMGYSVDSAFYISDSIGRELFFYNGLPDWYEQQIKEKQEFKNALKQVYQRE